MKPQLLVWLRRTTGSKKIQTLLPDIICHTTPHRGLKKNKTSYLPTVPKNRGCFCAPKVQASTFITVSSCPYYCTGIWHRLKCIKVWTHTANSIMGTLQKLKDSGWTKVPRNRGGRFLNFKGWPLLLHMPQMGSTNTPVSHQ